MSMWFLGIVFRKVENAESVNIDLTYVIQSFTDTGKPIFCSSLVGFHFFILAEIASQSELYFLLVLAIRYFYRATYRRLALKTYYFDTLAK